MSEDNDVQFELSSKQIRSSDIESKALDNPHNNSMTKSYENLQEKNDPLFIEDRTDNFKMHFPILFESQNNRSDTQQKQNACWNCGETNHSLYNCPEPRDQWTINQNRQIFIMQRQQYHQQKAAINRFVGRKNSRYFVENNYSHFGRYTVGKLSNDLKEALGLSKNRLPVHIYKMREFGYPNGWLEEAKAQFSGIEIFTAPNECVPFPGKEDEEENGIICINVKKLHEYPGFNVPPPPDTIDDFMKMGSPEFNPKQSVQNMIEKLNNDDKVPDVPEDNNHSDNIGFESISSGNNNNNYINNKPINVEESFCSKIVDEDLNCNRPPSSPEDGEITDDEICADLNDMECPSNETSEIVSEKVIDEEKNSNTFEGHVNTKEEESQLSISDSISENEFTTTPTSSKRKFGEVKTEVLGTPVLKRFSFYKDRPSHDKFAKGMVDLIEHENLPNSIGTFNKLKDILKDVRKTLSDLE